MKINHIDKKIALFSASLGFVIIATYLFFLSVALIHIAILSLFVSLVSYFVTTFLTDLYIFKPLAKVDKNIDQILKKKKLRLLNPRRSVSFINSMFRKILIISNSGEQEIRRLRENEEFRREFLGNVSHELKTPIFATSGFIETLLDGALEDPNVNRKFLRKASKQLDRMSTLIQDILMISRIESGDIQMEITSFDLIKLVEEVFEFLEHKLSKKNRDIKLNCSSCKGEVFILADQNRIRQVLVNLIDNGIKHGNPNGKILIEITKNDEKVMLSVVDDGPGIEKQHLLRLFERFYRVDKSRSREKGGTGLGLAIVKHFVEAHNEKIWVESQINVGTKFTFTLALDQAKY